MRKYQGGKSREKRPYGESIGMEKAGVENKNAGKRPITFTINPMGESIQRDIKYMILIQNFVRAFGTKNT